MVINEVKHTLSLSEEFVNRIIVGLGEIPTKFGAPVLSEIEKQISAARGSGEQKAVEQAQ